VPPQLALLVWDIADTHLGERISNSIIVGGVVDREEDSQSIDGGEAEDSGAQPLKP